MKDILIVLFVSTLSIGLPLLWMSRSQQEKKNLEKLRRRQIDNSRNSMKPISEVSALPLTLTNADKSRWGIPEYTLHLNSDPVITYWLNSGWSGTTGKLVEAETVEGRWLATWNKTNRWPYYEFSTIRLALSETRVVTLIWKTGKRYVLEFPDGRSFSWKLISHASWSSHGKWALTNEQGEHLILCDSKVRQVSIASKALVIPELTLLTLMGGYLAIREFDYDSNGSD